MQFVSAAFVVLAIMERDRSLTELCHIFFVTCENLQKIFVQKNIDNNDKS